MKPPNPSSLDEQILTQAAHWCMRLHDDTCTTEERLDFQRWVQNDPRHAFEYAKMLEIWDLSDELPNNQSTSKKLLTDPSTPRNGVRRM
jgi:transmembrane sensor